MKALHRTIRVGTVLAAVGLMSLPALAEDPTGTYAFDREGQHQFVQFRISHLGFSTLYGRFNDFNGEFKYDDENPENSTVEVTVDASSVDTNHSERDKHLRSDDFLYVDKYPDATFESTSVDVHDDGSAAITGDLTLRGVTREVEFDMELIKHGMDPWGNYRMGLEGTTTLTLDNFGIPEDLGPDAQQVDLMLSVEGIRQ